MDSRTVGVNKGRILRGLCVSLVLSAASLGAHAGTEAAAAGPSENPEHEVINPHHPAFGHTYRVGPAKFRLC
jgi:hypothetical protein